MKTYDYHHVVTLEDTNLVGNVYFVNHVRWQGRCRELFLLEHAPEIFEELARDLRLVTTSCSCDYFAELAPRDEVIVRMSLEDVAHNRITMGFAYTRHRGGTEELVARGQQQIMTMRQENGALVAAPIPETLRAALEPFMGS